MELKEYMTPDMDVVELKSQVAMLAGSIKNDDQPGQGGFGGDDEMD